VKAVLHEALAAAAAPPAAAKLPGPEGSGQGGDGEP